MSDDPRHAAVAAAYARRRYPFAPLLGAGKIADAREEATLFRSVDDAG